MVSYDGNAEVDLDKFPTAKALVECCKQFFSEVQDLTPGHELEVFLNANYGPGSPIFDDICKYIRKGIESNEGWCAVEEIDGPKYRRSKICLPSSSTRFFSITTVYMDNKTEYRGQYHKHPYGEINCVIPFSETAQLRGMSGWQGAGWTSPGPGTHHYPEVRGGPLVSLFFLPAGRISYEAKPGMPQPLTV